MPCTRAGTDQSLRRSHVACASGGDEAAGTPGEDLMQEHGGLERILLIYDEVGRRIDGGIADLDDFTPECPCPFCGGTILL